MAMHQRRAEDGLLQGAGEMAAMTVARQRLQWWGKLRGKLSL